MATRQRQPPRYHFSFEAPANGRIGKATVTVRDAGDKIVHSDKADLTCQKERRRVARATAELLSDVDAKDLEGQLADAWNEELDRRRKLREAAERGSAEAAPVGTVQLLDAGPPAVCRPLCLVNGTAYAAAWGQVQRSMSQSVEGGVLVQHDPPLVTVEEVLLIVARDGTLYADGGVPGARPLAELGLLVRLPPPPPPGRGWSGAGVKRYLAGERPGPAEVFGRVAAVVDRFIDFARSLAAQRVMCELAACYVLSTYLLDAFNVVGYLWPNGERGSGKTKFLQLLAELSYLGQLILAGSSYACLRDLADSGATLCFDDAEAVMDVKRSDPEKRSLLLAGNRKGATVAVKEKAPGDAWATRHVNTFCPRAFSAIRLPDEVLGSRSIIVPLVRSGDEGRAKADCLDPENWPADRRRLLDDLWALGLAHLPHLPAHDREAAAAASASGRNLDPWRPVLAVARWLEREHGVEGLFGRLERLSVSYQEERGDYEAADSTRVLFQALLGLSEGTGPDEGVQVRPKDLADAMNRIAEAEDLAEADRKFTTARRVGWLLKRQRFRRGEADEHGKRWELTRREIEDAARAYGVKVPDPGEDRVPF
jgi:hypothetical protein